MGPSLPLRGVQRLLRLSLFHDVNSNVMNDRCFKQLRYLCAALTNRAKKPQLGEQAIFSGSINFTLKCATISETEFVPRCKRCRYKKGLVRLDF